MLMMVPPLPSLTLGSESTHSSRTLMLLELALLFEAVPPGASPERYFEAVLHHNVLHKPTTPTRSKTFKYLRELYGLDPTSILFPPLRRLWASDSAAQPALALLSAVVSDTLLRSSAEFVLSLERGASVTTSDFSQVIASAFPQRFGAGTLTSTAQNIASSWTQSGHLRGKTRKTRSQVKATPASVAYALYLGYLEGARGLMLYQTLWARLLDHTPSELDVYSRAAAQQGWLEYRRIGDVAELSFEGLTLPTLSQSTDKTSLATPLERTHVLR